MQPTHSLTSIPDDELLRRLAELLGQSRRVESDLVAHVGEVDSRRLYAREASPSMFAYCTEVLHLSEAEAYLRIAAARASREHPVLLEMLADGRLHLTGIAKLAPHLTRENRETLLQAAAGKSKRQIEELIAELFPRPDAPAVIRKLPSAGPHPELGRALAATAGLELRPEAVASGGVHVDRAESSSTRLGPDGVAPTGLEPGAALSSAARPARIEPLAPGRYKVQFTASAELREKLERLQALRRGFVPDGDLAAIIEEAVTEKLERLEARRFARTKAPRKALADGQTRAGSRHVPAAVRRAVHERDGGRCRYVDEQGRRCTAREGLEFHHRHPFGHGGDHSVGNIALICRLHNSYLAEVDYGREAMERHRSPRTVTEQPNALHTG
jgi:hypothetical protein